LSCVRWQLTDSNHMRRQACCPRAWILRGHTWSEGCRDKNHDERDFICEWGYRV